MTTLNPKNGPMEPPGSNGKRTHAPDGDALLDAIERDPEAQACPEWAAGIGGGHEWAIALIAAVDRLLSSGCPLHPEPLRYEADEPVEGTLSPGINCHICNFTY